MWACISIVQFFIVEICFVTVPLIARVCHMLTREGTVRVICEAVRYLMGWVHSCLWKHLASFPKVESNVVALNDAGFLFTIVSVACNYVLMITHLKQCSIIKNITKDKSSVFSYTRPCPPSPSRHQDAVRISLTLHHRSCRYSEVMFHAVVWRQISMWSCLVQL